MMSTFAAMSGTLACIFSLLGSKKWIIRDGLNGMSATGVGAPTARGRRKARGFRICPVCPPRPQEGTGISHLASMATTRDAG